MTVGSDACADSPWGQAAHALSVHEPICTFRGVAQPGLERLLWEQEAAGSNPAAPTTYARLRCLLCPDCAPLGGTSSARETNVCRVECSVRCVKSRFAARKSLAPARVTG